MTSAVTHDVIVIGAGAAGLHCAATAAKRGRRVLVLDHAKQAGKKILISGGGRCNFTNMYASPENYLSENPHFCKSALSRYTQWDFIGLVNDYGIAYHEKTLGQLFCDHSAKDIVNMLMKECAKYGAHVQLRTEVLSVKACNDGLNDGLNDGFVVHTSQGLLQAEKVVVACGGLSMPKLGATPLGYQLAEQFGHRIVPVRAGLVPFTLHDADKQRYAELSGLSVDVVVSNQSASNQSASFKEAMLFTHRGVSGPAMLQISSYWHPGEALEVNLLPHDNVFESLSQLRTSRPRMSLRSAVQEWFPKRLALALCEQYQWPDKNLADCSNTLLQHVSDTLHQWQLKPNGTEGYRTAEVTLGGVDTHQISSKTMESSLQPGLFFIGEVLDVTGWLGGYNFQWAWSSGWVCGESI